MLSWGAAWVICLLVGLAGFDAVVAFGGGLTASLLLALHCGGRWRRAITAIGFPLSAWALGGAAGLPAWLWLLLLLPLLAVYPMRAWRDAPFFPTPAQALQGLSSVVTQAPTKVLDVGCGLGHGLAALHALWPRAAVHGVESSGPLAWLATRRCPYAHIERRDMWAADWSTHDLVYAFQRPDNMARLWAKVERELKPGAWLVSLEFPVPGDVAAYARLVCPDGRDLWIYQTPSCPPSPATGHSTAPKGGR